ncbi:hypothetical protein WG66_010203 [Moniliophthora roreri]|nr:hypothetical protein WG66_010203 [Moniliophthora roreri]
MFRLRLFALLGGSLPVKSVIALVGGRLSVWMLKLPILSCSLCECAEDATSREAKDSIDDQIRRIPELEELCPEILIRSWD